MRSVQRAGGATATAAKRRRLCTDAARTPPPRFYRTNGLRHVRPYLHRFETFVKGRWLGRELLETYAAEFRGHTPAYYAQAIADGRIRVSGSTVDARHKLGHREQLQHLVLRHEPPVLDAPLVPAQARMHAFPHLADTEEVNAAAVSVPVDTQCDGHSDRGSNSDAAAVTDRPLSRAGAADRISATTVCTPREAVEALAGETRLFRRRRRSLLIFFFWTVAVLLRACVAR